MSGYPTDLAAQVEAWCQTRFGPPCAGCGCEGVLALVGDRWLCSDCRGELLELPPRLGEVA